MISQKKYDFLRQNFIFYLTGILVVLGIKLYYSRADCDSLLWILAPTTRWVELLSGIPFVYISGTGYVNHSLRLLIAPTCSGVRFMITAIATLVFSFVHRAAAPQGNAAAGSFGRLRRGLGWIGASIVFSWLYTVLVNGLRIIAAIYLPMYLERAGLMKGMLTPDRLHTMIGITVYFAALLSLYRLAGVLVERQAHAEKERLSPLLVHKFIPPVFWYFVMTLGLPLLGGSYLKGAAKFTEYTVLIVGCCTLILLPYGLLTLLHGRNKKYRS